VPHLTRDLRLAGCGVPAPGHPLVAPGEWAELARPGAPVHWVAVDAPAAPGDRPDPLLVQAVSALHDAGVRVLGRLDTAHGTRPLREAAAAAERLAARYRVDGFHLDRAPAGRDRLPALLRLTAHLRGLPGGGHLVLDHGTHPDPGYADAADQLVTYRGPWRDYRWSQAPPWTAGHPPERFCHLVHGVPRPHLETALRIARWQGAATVYLTDRSGVRGTDPFDGLPAFWAEMSGMIGGPSPS